MPTRINAKQGETMQYKVVAALMLAAFGAVTGCAKYSGSGGMTAYQIKPDVYEYHYDNGFTGADSLGWDPNLQYAWSRTGAALTCGVAMKKDLILENMKITFGNDIFVHELNGVGFHHIQSNKIERFCTKGRVAELNEVIPKFEAGDFPKKF